MTYGDAILKAVLDDPADDLPRLAYADWLEEDGDPACGRFIRSQIAGEAAAPPPPPWPGAHVAALCRVAVPRVSPGQVSLQSPSAPREPPTVVYRRGFVAEVSCPLQDWLAHGPAVVRGHPVERVGVVDKGPWLHTAGGAHGEYACWWRGEDSPHHSGHRLPAWLWGLLAPKIMGGVGWGAAWQRYRTVEDATAALSNALLLWAKAPECGYCRGRGAWTAGVGEEVRADYNLDVVVNGGSDSHVTCNIEEGASAQVVHNMSGGGELHVTCNRCRGSGRRPDWRPDGAEEYEQLPPGLSFTS
jgi:uncharacterized protein (TIGR02996 family)